MPPVVKKKKYGLYDFLKRDLTEYELTQAPPREVYEILLIRFGFKKRQINKHSLGSWLRRTRKRYKEGRLSLQAKTGRTIMKSVITGEKTNDSFVGFEPTDPMAQPLDKNSKATLLKRPSYTK
jgi:hypothetical protein